MWNLRKWLFGEPQPSLDDEPGTMVEPRPEDTAFIWSFCHKVDPNRDPHTVRLKLIKIVDENRSGTFDRSIYRCVECGQYYFYAYNCASDWTSYGDRDFGQHSWEPISVDEMWHIRKTHDFILSPREHLRFGS